MTFGLDAYTRNARLKPALITALPTAWTVMAWAPGNALGWSGLWSLFVAGGGMWLLSQMARDRGKRSEKELFDKFGGRPTEQLLSHAQAPNKVRLSRQHEKLRGLLPDVHIPSADDEMKDPSAAHEVYVACTGYLISRTRDDRLLFQENMNYGFRRNLWGLKPFGVAISAGGAVALGLRLYLDFSTQLSVLPLTVVFELLNVLMLAAWLFWFRSSWVMIPAYAYADRLLDALDILED